MREAEVEHVPGALDIGLVDLFVLVLETKGVDPGQVVDDGDILEVPGLGQTQVRQGDVPLEGDKTWPGCRRMP
ncbi:hypothetical protein ES703_107333 [subsurface metagenome]